MKQLTRTLPELTAKEAILHTFLGQRRSLSALLDMQDHEVYDMWEASLKSIQGCMLSLNQLHDLTGFTESVTSEDLAERLTRSLGYNPRSIESFMDSGEKLTLLSPTGIRMLIEELDANLEELESLAGGIVSLVLKQRTQGINAFKELSKYDECSDDEKRQADNVIDAIYGPAIMTIHMVYDELFELCEKFLKKHDV